MDEKGDEINPRKGEDQYILTYANEKRTYDAYQDLDLTRARNQEAERAQAAIDAQLMKVKLDNILAEALSQRAGDDNSNRNAQRFNGLMNQAGANRLWFETEIPEAEALATLLKAGKLGSVDLALWIERLEAIVNELKNMGSK